MFESTYYTKPSENFNYETNSLSPTNSLSNQTSLSSASSIASESSTFDITYQPQQPSYNYTFNNDCQQFANTYPTSAYNNNYSTYPTNQYYASPYHYYQVAPQQQHPQNFLPISPAPHYDSQQPTQTTDTSVATPEKQNDSGIEVISPTYPILQPQQHQHQYQTLYSSKSSSTAESATTTNTDESILNNSESDDDSDEEEFNESSKENLNEKCDKNKKSTKKGSSSASSASSVTPTKPPKPYLEIIADAILSCKVKMMQLHEIYHYMESKYEYFIKNVNKSWRNSVRHNLSLNECFVKAGRGSNGKGNYWKIHPLCEKEFIRGCFRRKSFKQLIRAGSAHAAANQHQAYQQNHGHNMATYNLPVDYSINFRSMVPPPMPQQFLSSSNNNSVHLNSFQYPVFSNNTNSSVNSAESPQFQSSMQNNSFNSYIKSESIAALNKGSDEFKQQSTANNINNNGFHPYRV